MSNRIINLNISDAYISAIGGSIGATGSGNATTLRMTFDEHWDGTTKTVYFKDANGQNPVSVVVGVDTLVSGTTYDINVPPITLATAGMASMSVRGVILNETDRSKVDRSITTQAVWFKVLNSDITWTGGTISATDKEQLQAEIDALTTVFTSSKTAAETAAATATTKAGEAAASATAAAGSASTAEGKATLAAGSAASAATSAATATTKASEASVSAAGAADSATSAASSAASAASAKNSAELAQTAAESSATGAASSAAAALESAGKAATSETNAGNSASAATAAASAAQTAKTAAETASENAQSFKTEAAQSASEAAASAAQAAAIVGGDFATHEDVGTAKDEAISAAAADAAQKANAAQSAAEATAATALAAHTGDTSNPHGVTSAQIGAQPVLTAGTNITISGNTISATGGLCPRIVVTAPTGSNVTCTKGTTTLTAAESSGTWTFDVPDYGTWTLTATKSGQTATKSVVVDQVKQYAASLVYLSNTFSANTWEAIIGACQSGSVPAAWVVGNQKAMTINSVSYTVTIIGKGHDTYAGGGTAPLTFQLQDCYGTTYNMNSSNTNNGGWTSCAMRATHLPAILALMPAEVQAGIREVNKLTSAGDQSATINTTADKLFLLSEVEIFGNVTYAKAGEGSQYAYYSAGNSKVKKFNGSASHWWERSPYGSNTADFCRVGSNGSADAASASTARGVAFGFCF